MSSTPSSLSATRRVETGKAVAALRKQGKLPAVVFGHGMESVNVSIDAHEFEQLRRHVHSTSMVDLRVDGAAPRKVLIHGVQVNPITRRPVHVDLYAVRSGEEVHLDVPIVTYGESFAVDKLGGVLLHNLDNLKVKALPENLPDEFRVDIAVLGDFDAAIHVRDIPIPEGVTLLTDPDEVVTKVVAPHRPEAAPEVAAPAEGEEEAVATEEGATSGSERPDRGEPEASGS